MPANAAEPTLSWSGDVAVLDLGAGENRLNPESVGRVHECIDAATSVVCSALITKAQGKYWSNGLDVDWYAAHELDEGLAAFNQVRDLCARIMLLPFPTVAAVTGHAVAGGAILALAHDTRVMQGERGFFWLPEVSLGVVLDAGLLSLLDARLPARAVTDLVVHGRRCSAEEAAAIGAVDRVVVGHGWVESLVAEFGSLPAGPAVGGFKERLHGAVVDQLRNAYVDAPIVEALQYAGGRTGAVATEPVG